MCMLLRSWMKDSYVNFKRGAFLTKHSFLCIWYLPMTQKTVDPAEPRMNSGRLINKTSPYCSTLLKSRPANWTRTFSCSGKCYFSY